MKKVTKMKKLKKLKKLKKPTNKTMKKHASQSTSATVDALLARTPSQVLRGAAAAAHGRATLEAAGIDVDALERRSGPGRPSVSRALAPGQRSPRVNVAVSMETDQRIKDLAEQTGISRSELVREALDLSLIHI